MKSRRLKQASIDMPIPEGQGYCRRCTKIKRALDFPTAVDKELDKNGLMSICKNCINEIYENFLRSENGSIQKTILRMCRMLNVRYSEEAIVAAQKHIDSIESDPLKFFSLYKAKLLNVYRGDMSNSVESVDLTYQEVTHINFNVDLPSEFEVSADVVKYWGRGYEIEDYAWLEEQLSEWKKSHKCDNKAEETLLREIVFKQFQIEKARQEGTSEDALQKQLQDLMKTASVDPSKANVAGGDKSRDTFSAFIKMIEENEPAEYYKDKSIFKDFDNIGFYFEKYVVRPLRNFVTGSRDFNTESEAEWDESNEGLFPDELSLLPDGGDTEGV